METRNASSIALDALYMETLQLKEKGGGGGLFDHFKSGGGGGSAAGNLKNND